MNIKIKRKVGLTAVTVAMAGILFVLPVSAKTTYTEDVLESVSQYVETDLETFYTYGEESTEQFYSLGGFYEIFADALKDNYDITGSFQEVESISTEYDEDDDELICTAQLKFEKYTAEAEIYIDGELESDSVLPYKNYILNVNYSLSEKMGQAGMNTVIGIGSVFLLLLFLAGVIACFGVICKTKKQEKEPAKACAQAVKSQSYTDIAAKQDDAEIIAVIAAAIAAAEANAQSENGYVVRSIKKVNNTRRWNRF